MSKALKQNTEPHGAYIGEIIRYAAEYSIRIK